VSNNDSLCETVLNALSAHNLCELTDDGARVRTHCLYPSFEPVHVYVRRFGDGFIIHDRGEAASRAWLHGRDDKVLNRYLARAAERYGVRFDDGRLSAKVESLDWLKSGLLAVSNAASQGSSAAVEHVARSEAEALRDRISHELVQTFSRQRISAEVIRRGESGREYRFDFEVKGDKGIAVVEAVTPFANSIFSKYTAFSDTKALYMGGGFAVHDRELDQKDVTLLSQVADVIPLSRMTVGIQHRLHITQ
jgi:hypothetical protein